MTNRPILTLLCFLAPLAAGADTLDVYGQLTGKTVLMSSGLPRLPDSIIADLPADNSNAITKIESAFSEQGVELVQDGPHFVRLFRREARDSLTNAPLRGAELGQVNGQETAPPGMIDFSNADLSQVLEIYDALSQRSVLRPATLPAPTINLMTRGRLTRQEATYAIAIVLALNGICLVDDGAKFVQAVPMARRKEVTTGAPKPEPGAELVPAGSINFSGADLNQALAIYATMKQRTILRPTTLPLPLVYLKTESLTRVEALYAMEKVFALNGICVMDDGTKFVQVVPGALRAQVQTNAPKPEPGAELFDPEKVPSLGFSPVPGPQTETDQDVAQRLLEFYADLAGKTAVPEPKYERASIWFHISTPLSKGELLYAIESTFVLNGFTIIPVDDHSIRLGRPAQVPRNNGRRL
jgi:hypothetical protein